MRARSTSGLRKHRASAFTGSGRTYGDKITPPLRGIILAYFTGREVSRFGSNIRVALVSWTRNEYDHTRGMELATRKIHT